LSILVALIPEAARVDLLLPDVAGICTGGGGTETEGAGAPDPRVGGGTDPEEESVSGPWFEGRSPSPAAVSSSGGPGVIGVPSLRHFLIVATFHLAYFCFSVTSDDS